MCIARVVVTAAAVRRLVEAGGAIRDAGMGLGVGVRESRVKRVRRLVEEAMVGRSVRCEVFVEPAMIEVYRCRDRYSSSDS